MRSAILSQNFHKRNAAFIMIAVAALYVVLTSGMAGFLPPQGDQGICLPSPGEWKLPGWVAIGSNVALNIAIMSMMMIVNKTFNVLRAMTWLHVGLFAIMQAALPREIVTLNSGTLLALAVICCIYLLFSCYAQPERVRRVFLAFMVLSLGATTQYSFVVFIPVFWLITVQMRIFNTRTLLASVLGLLTPWVILFGLGIVTPADVHVPEITSVFGDRYLRPALYVFIIAVLTAFLLVISTVLNVLKTIAYNAQARSYNGALTVVASVTIMAMLVNYNNLLAYLPLLNMCAAYQLTHYFVNHRFDRQYAAVLAVCAVYVVLYLWRITIQR